MKRMKRRKFVKSLFLTVSAAPVVAATEPSNGVIGSFAEKATGELVDYVDIRPSDTPVVPRGKHEWYQESLVDTFAGKLKVCGPQNSVDKFVAVVSKSDKL